MLKTYLNVSHSIICRFCVSVFLLNATADQYTAQWWFDQSYSISTNIKLEKKVCSCVSV